jgi:hypothetical protein
MSFVCRTTAGYHLKEKYLRQNVVSVVVQRSLIKLDLILLKNKILNVLAYLVKKKNVSNLIHIQMMR